MGDQFRRDQRMPTGCLHDVLDENVPCDRVNFGIEHGDELAEVVASEGAQRDVSDLDATFECGQESPRRDLPVASACRQHPPHIRDSGSDDVDKQRDSTFIGPVDVVDHHRQRRVAGGVGDQRFERGDQPEPSNARRTTGVPSSPSISRVTSSATPSLAAAVRR